MKKSLYIGNKRYKVIFRDSAYSLNTAVATYAINYRKKPAGVDSFIIYVNNEAKSTNPSGGSIQVSHGDKVYAIAEAKNCVVSIYNISSNSNAPTIVTDNIDIDLVVTRKTYTATFTKPEFGSWEYSSLTLSEGTTWKVNKDKITFTDPDGKTVTNTATTTISPTAYTLSFAADENGYGTWSSTDNVSVYDYSYSTPTIQCPAGDSITANSTFTANITRTPVAFTNEIIGMAGDDNSYEGTQTWKISGTDTAGQVFTREFTVTHNEKFYYKITGRSHTVTQAVGNITFTPTVARTTHTYPITIKGSEYGTVYKQDGITLVTNKEKVPYGTILILQPAAQLDHQGYTLGVTATGELTDIGSKLLPKYELVVKGSEIIEFTRTANTYTVEYKNDSGWATGGTLPATQERTYPKAVKLAVNSMTKQSTKYSEYTVIYNYNGGSEDRENDKATTYRNYTADGWTTTEKSTIQTHANELVFGANNTENLVLHPCFIYSTSGGFVTLPNSTRTGYTLTAWNDGNASVGTAGDSYKPRGDITLTASWKANKYKVAFNANGGATSTASKDVTYDSSYGTLPESTRDGYTHTGWFTADGTQIKADSVVTITENTTLYAQWQANEYTVKFNGNEATSGSMSDQTFTYDVAQNLTDNAFSRTYTVTYNANGGFCDKTNDAVNYKFNGWATLASGSKVYNDKQSVSNLTSINNGIVRLFATWEGGTVDLPTPTREGYYFRGWAESPTASTGRAGKYTPENNVTLYATWEIKKYKITISNEGVGAGTVLLNGTPISSETSIEHGKSLTVIPNTADEQYKYIAKYPGQENGTYGAGGFTVTADATITFSAELQKYTVTFNVNPAGYGTVSAESVTVPYGTSIAPKTTGSNIMKFGTGEEVTVSPADESYYFTGWTDPGISTVYGPMAITANFAQILSPSLTDKGLYEDENGAYLSFTVTNNNPASVYVYYTIKDAVSGKEWCRDKSAGDLFGKATSTYYYPINDIGSGKVIVECYFMGGDIVRSKPTELPITIIENLTPPEIYFIKYQDGRCDFNINNNNPVAVQAYYIVKDGVINNEIIATDSNVSISPHGSNTIGLGKIDNLHIKAECYFSAGDLTSDSITKELGETLTLLAPEFIGTGGAEAGGSSEYPYANIPIIRVQNKNSVDVEPAVTWTAAGGADVVDASPKLIKANDYNDLACNTDATSVTCNVRFKAKYWNDSETVEKIITLPTLDIPEIRYSGILENGTRFVEIVNPNSSSVSPIVTWVDENGKVLTATTPSTINAKGYIWSECATDAISVTCSVYFIAPGYKQSESVSVIITAPKLSKPDLEARPSEADKRTVRVTNNNSNTVRAYVTWEAPDGTIKSTANKSISVGGSADFAYTTELPDVTFKVYFTADGWTNSETSSMTLTSLKPPKLIENTAKYLWAPMNNNYWCAIVNVKNPNVEKVTAVFTYSSDWGSTTAKVGLEPGEEKVCISDATPLDDKLMAFNEDLGNTLMISCYFTNSTGTSEATALSESITREETNAIMMDGIIEL